MLLHVIVHSGLIIERTGKLAMGALKARIRADVFELLLLLDGLGCICGCSGSDSRRGTIHRRSLTDLDTNRHGYFKDI